MNVGVKQLFRLSDNLSVLQDGIHHPVVTTETFRAFDGCVLQLRAIDNINVDVSAPAIAKVVVEGAPGYPLES